MKKIYIVLSFCFFEFLFFSSSSFAANLSLSIEPAMLRVQIKPGKSITKAYSIHNKSTEDKVLVARVVPFFKSDLLGNPVLDIKNRYEWLNYFKLSNADIELDKPFTIKADSSQQLVLSLSIPETAPLKDLYATLLVSTYTNLLSSEQKGTVVSGSIGTNLLVSITSEINPKTILKIEKIRPTSGTYFHFGNIYLVDNLSPITFEAEVLNEGEFTAETRGLFKIIKKNEPVFLMGILPQYVISKSSRALTPIKNEKFRFDPEFRYIGSYQAVFEIKTDNANSQNSLNLFLFPFKAILGLFVGLVLLILIITKR